MRDQPSFDTTPAHRSSHLRGRGVLVAAALLALGFVACKKPEAGSQKDAVAEERDAGAPVTTKFAKVVEQKVAPRLEVTGQLDPDERSEVASQTNGVAMTVNVDIGSRVKKGDILVDLDAREAAMRLDVANATAASQRARLGLKGRDKFDPDSVADVKAARDAATLAKTDYERTKMLFEQGAISKSQFDTAKTNMDRAEAAYDSARNGAEQAWVSLLASQSQAGLSSKSLDDTKIRAPFDGMIEAKKIAPGEFAAMGRVVVTLVRDNPLRFKFDVPEAQSGLIAPGSAIELRVAAFPQKTFKGVIKRVGATIKTQTRALPVEAEFSNEDLQLRPGFFARGSVQLAGEPVTVLLVPRGAVLPLSGGSKVFVKNGDRVQERLVVTGATHGDLVEVKGQLAVGDEVAIENVSDLADGIAIAD